MSLGRGQRSSQPHLPLWAITFACEHGQHSSCQDIGRPWPLCCCDCHPWQVDLNYLRWVKNHRLSDDQLRQLTESIRAEYGPETSPLRHHRRAA